MKNKKSEKMSHAKVLVLVSIAFLIMAAVYVSAEYTNVPKGGHSADKILVLDKDGAEKSLQQAIDEQTLSSGFAGGIIDADAATFTRADDGCNAAYLNIWDSSDNRGWQLVNRQVGCGGINDALNFYFYDGAAWSEKMTLLPDGLVEVHDGDFKLSTAGDDPGDIIFENGAGAQKARIWSEPTAATGLHLSSGDSSPDLSIAESGNVGIKTWSPRYPLDVFGQGHFSRDGAGECCSNGDFTLSLAENTVGTGKEASIQFHNAGLEEGYIKLTRNTITGSNGREFLIGSNQATDMDLRVTGMVQAAQGQACTLIMQKTASYTYPAYYSAFSPPHSCLSPGGCELRMKMYPTTNPNYMSTSETKFIPRQGSNYWNSLGFNYAQGSQAYRRTAGTNVNNYAEYITAIDSNGYVVDDVPGYENDARWTMRCYASGSYICELYVC